LAKLRRIGDNLGMEEWKIGIMECWSVGVLECWKSGNRNVQYACIIIAKGRIAHRAS